MSAPLPARDGVGPSSVWLPNGAWKTVLEFLTERFSDISTATWIARMERGDVVDEHGARLSPESSYRGGIKLFYYRETRNEAPIPFDEIILYRDDHLIVVDKPHFLPVVPSGRFLQETLLIRLKRKLQLDFLVPIHRLDRETAGLVLFAIQPEGRAAYHAMFQNREVVKTYEALAPLLHKVTFPLIRKSRIAEGDPFFRSKEVDGEPNAETHIELIENQHNIGRYRLTPVSGRKHQLRVHMAALGMPILNDSLYPDITPVGDDDYSHPLQLLAKAIAFVDPHTRLTRRFESSRKLSFPSPT